MTPGEVLIPGAVAIVFVVAWFVFGLIDATRGDSHRRSATARGTEPTPEPAPEPVPHTAHGHHR